MINLRAFRAWSSEPSSRPALASLTFAVALICVEAGLFAQGRVLAGEILDAVLVLILLNVGRDPALGLSDERAAAAMRALALVALVRVVAAGLPLGDGSQALGILVVALLIVPTALGVGYVASVPVWKLMALGAVGAPLLASAAGLLLGLAAYFFGAPRVWSTGAHAGGIALALAAATAAATAEELVFRGVVQATFQRVVGRLGVVVATALFAATYLSAGSAGLVLVVALAGAVFGYVVWRAGSLAGAIAGHVLLALSAGALWPELLSADHGAWSHSVAATILAAVALAGAAASVMRWSDPTPVAPVPIPPHEPAPAPALPPEPTPTPPPARTPPEVVAILAVARRLGLPELLEQTPSRERELCLAVIVALALSDPNRYGRSLTEAIAETTLASEAGTEEIGRALDWLRDRQKKIELHLVARHVPSTRVPPLYDVRVSPEGGHAVLCDLAGRPLAVEPLSMSVGRLLVRRTDLDRMRDAVGVRDAIVTSDRTTTIIASLGDWPGVGWIVAIDPEDDPGPGEMIIDDPRIGAAPLRLRIGGKALALGVVRAQLAYRDVTDPRLRLAPLVGVRRRVAASVAPEPARLLAGLLAAYVVWHLLSAWAELLVDDSLQTVFAALAKDTAFLGRAIELIEQRVDPLASAGG